VGITVAELGCTTWPSGGRRSLDGCTTGRTDLCFVMAIMEGGRGIACYDAANLDFTQVDIFLEAVNSEGLFHPLASGGLADTRPTQKCHDQAPSPAAATPSYYAKLQAKSPQLPPSPWLCLPSPRRDGPRCPVSCCCGSPPAPRPRPWPAGLHAPSQLHQLNTPVYTYSPTSSNRIPFRHSMSAPTVLAGGALGRRLAAANVELENPPDIPLFTRVGRGGPGMRWCGETGGDTGMRWSALLQGANDNGT
jgi:hypothetical protein